MIDKLVLQFETCPENRDLVKFLRFFDTQIDNQLLTLQLYVFYAYKSYKKGFMQKY